MYGVDVSHYQNPEHVPYDKVDFVIVKVTEGTSVDQRAADHIKKVREAKKLLGMYHFFRRDIDFNVQYRAFLSALERFELSVGDFFPFLDIEEHKRLLPNNSWNDRCIVIVNKLDEVFGGCIPYFNKRDFHLLGSPEWIMKRPNWFAEYGEYSPPNKDNAVIWQHRVGPFEYEGSTGMFTPRDIDQDKMMIDDISKILIQGEGESDEQETDQKA